MSNLEDVKRLKAIKFLEEYKSIMDLEKENQNLENIDFEDLLIKYIDLYKKKDFNSFFANRKCFLRLFDDILRELLSKFKSFELDKKEDIILSIKNALASISLDNDENKDSNKSKENSLINIEKQCYEFILSEFVKLV